MTVIYLQCQKCQGLGTRTRKRERCKYCGQVADVRNEVVLCRLCGGNTTQVEHMAWERLRHQEGEYGTPKYPHEA